jgi:hypothetical protein
MVNFGSKLAAARKRKAAGRASTPIGADKKLARPAFRPVTEREPGDDAAERPRPPFLKAEHIGRGAKVTLIPGTVRTMNGNYGPQLIVDVTCNGSVYSWGISTNAPNLRLLVESLVNAPGKAISIKPMISANNRPYIAITDTQDDGGPRRGRAPQDDDDIPF